MVLYNCKNKTGNRYQKYKKSYEVYRINNKNMDIINKLAFDFLEKK